MMQFDVPSKHVKLLICIYQNKLLKWEYFMKINYELQIFFQIYINFLKTYKRVKIFRVLQNSKFTHFQSIFKYFDINVHILIFSFYNREVSMQPWDTWRRITGIITFTIQWRDLIGWEIRMQSITCVRKPPRLLLSSKTTACRSADLRTVKFTRELSEVRALTTVKEDRLIAVAV